LNLRTESAKHFSTTITERLSAGHSVREGIASGAGVSLCVSGMCTNDLRDV